MAEDSVEKTAEKPVRDNTLERRYWAWMGWRPDFKEPEKKGGKRDAIVKVKPGHLDPNWISTGNVWMHAGNLIPE